MPRLTGEGESKFRKFLEDYQDCWYRRDSAALRRIYCSDGDVSYFDNHADCTTTEIDEHIRKVSAFFNSGNMVELLNEDFQVWEHGGAACITATHRYSTHPRPGVRATYYLEKEKDGWRIRHIHCSANPDETES